MKDLSGYALKSMIHAIGVKNIPVFLIHEVRAVVKIMTVFVSDRFSNDGILYSAGS